MYEVLNI